MRGRGKRVSERDAVRRLAVVAVVLSITAAIAWPAVAAATYLPLGERVMRGRRASCSRRSCG